MTFVAHQFRTRALPAFAVSILCWVGTASAETQGVQFDYNKQNDSTVVNYASSLSITLTGVNTLDYDYTISMIALPPSPQPGPPVGPRALAGLQPCLTAVNTQLSNRAQLLGQVALAKWWQDLRTVTLTSPDCAGSDITKAITNRLLEAGNPDVAGTLAIDPQALAAQLVATGPGGGIVLTIKATAFITTLELNEKADDVTIKRTAVTTSLSATRSAEIMQRQFTVRFGPPTGVLISFGPYLSGLHRTTYQAVPNPANSASFVIGTSQDSSVSYGIAAYWTARLVGNCLEMCGLTWGVAYNAQSDNILAGFIGAGLQFTKTPLIFHVGAAIGNETRLQGGYVAYVTPISATQALPTKTVTTVRWGLGISFATNAP
jgi:hypothetical protein